MFFCGNFPEVDRCIVFSNTPPKKQHQHSNSKVMGNVQRLKFFEAPKNVHLKKLGLAWPRCLEKVPKIFSQMVVQNGDETHGIESVKNHQLNKSQHIIPHCQWAARRSLLFLPSSKSLPSSQCCRTLICGGQLFHQALGKTQDGPQTPGL